MGNGDRIVGFTASEILAAPIRAYDDPDLYAIRPRPEGGVNLESFVLSHGRLRYESESDAVGFAKWNSRVKGGKIDIYNEGGELVRTEEFPPGNYTY